MSASRLPLYITINDIARIAGVGRSAVANWRKRHSDFPLANQADRFDLDEVERWLIEKGKIPGRAPRSLIFWSLADAFRTVARPADVMQFILGGLIYLEACERSLESKSDGIRIPVSFTWTSIREAADEDLPSALIQAAERIESDNPPLLDLIVPAFQVAKRVDPWFLRAFLDTLEESSKDDARFALFEEAIARVQYDDRFQGEFSTPDDLTHLMVRLGAAEAGTVFDPAAGGGGLLLMAALGDHRDHSKPMALIGFERNNEVLHVSRARFFLYDVPIQLRSVDAFNVLPKELPAADLVLLDPPLGAHWGNADIYLQDRWTFGVPPPSNGDLAWVQLALQSLTPTGRAVVVTTPATTSREGREAAIRSSLINAGCVVAVVLLPSRLRTNTSIPLALWVLRSPDSHTKALLLVDASQLGQAGRSTHSLGVDDIDRIVAAVHKFEANPDQEPTDSKIAWRIAVEELQDSSLNPIRYRPAPQPDVDELRLRREQIRNTFREHAATAEVAVAKILKRLEDER